MSLGRGVQDRTGCGLYEYCPHFRVIYSPNSMVLTYYLFQPWAHPFPTRLARRIQVLSSQGPSSLSCRSSGSASLGESAVLEALCQGSLRGGIRALVAALPEGFSESRHRAECLWRAVEEARSRKGSRWWEITGIYKPAMNNIIMNIINSVMNNEFILMMNKNDDNKWWVIMMIINE